jgi:hypothetical protein
MVVAPGNTGFRRDFLQTPNYSILDLEAWRAQDKERYGEKEEG